MKHLFSLATLALALALPLRAQEGGLFFLRIGANAASQALGDAGVAHSRDAFSTYWNPAGLAVAPKNMAALTLHRWAGDVQTYGLAARLQAGAAGGLGLFVTATGSGDRAAFQDAGASDGLFDAQFISAGASYGRAFGPVRAGATVKFLSERLTTRQADGIAFDFGVQADLPGRTLRVGAAYQNLGKMSRPDAGRSELPRLLRAGVAFFPFRVLARLDDAPILNTFLVFELSHNFAGKRTQYHLGMAAEVMELVTVRAGYITNDALRDFSFGGGLEYGAFVVDYTLLPFEEGFGTAGHILTLSYGW
ncbi:PorV/PorQ family protein [Rhodocaloribacter litoris]|uniref:PorV/PorQ family protein n=1 Tax=Rhodocaloribacter litoris TaxID=2558931 RepID=UPI00141E0ED8|nr:PorV/PorQ family protein [Rhodocaloribacter litoris]QXD14608.1 PorV/PorQ family protein [Rhodocaloribacter litoris]